MELISGGSLKTLLEKRKNANQRFTEEELKKMMNGIMNVVRYLHENEIVHRDLKPENILLQDPDDLSSIKIIDFGLSVKFIDMNKNLYLNCGTPLFAAPELKKYKIYSKPVDIWSCGIIFYELCTMGEHPFHRRGVKEKPNEAVEENFTIKYPEDLPPYVKT
jgi:calcium/calmodulin-dependent protein kinase I